MNKYRQRGKMRMEKIKMTTPLVEMDGDEMTRVLWQLIKDELLTPFVDLNTEYYDLGLVHRNETNDQVTIDSAEATKKYGVAVKCATITPNAARVKEYDLKEMYKSPNGTIRALLDGTVFRAPIIVKGIEPYVKTWKKPITIARHAYGDVYKASEMKVPGAGKAELVFTAEDGTQTKELIHEFKGAGVLQGMHNLNGSIESFARSCFNFALETKQDLWFATKDTISKKYDHTFKDIFQEVYDNDYKAKFEEAGITYFYTLIEHNYVALYIWGCIAATIFEYLTAQVMLRLFDEVWWDYTHKKINYKGILCLQSTLGWGFLALFIFGIFNQLVENLVFALDERFVCFFGAVLTISFAFFNIFYNLRYFCFKNGKSAFTDMATALYPTPYGRYFP